MHAGRMDVGRDATSGFQIKNIYILNVEKGGRTKDAGRMDRGKINRGRMHAGRMDVGRDATSGFQIKSIYILNVGKGGRGKD